MHFVADSGRLAKGAAFCIQAVLGEFFKRDQSAMVSIFTYPWRNLYKADLRRGASLANTIETDFKNWHA